MRRGGFIKRLLRIIVGLFLELFWNFSSISLLWSMRFSFEHNLSFRIKSTFLMTLNCPLSSSSKQLHWISLGCPISRQLFVKLSSLEIIKIDILLGRLGASMRLLYYFKRFCKLSFLLSRILTLVIRARKSYQLLLILPFSIAFDQI